MIRPPISDARDEPVRITPPITIHNPLVLNTASEKREATCIYGYDYDRPDSPVQGKILPIGDLS